MNFFHERENAAKLETIEAEVRETDAALKEISEKLDT